MGLKPIFERIDQLKFMLSVEKRKKIGKIPISEIMEEEGISRPTYYNYKKSLDKWLKQLGYKSFLNVYEIWLKNPDIIDEIEKTDQRLFGEYRPEAFEKETEKQETEIKNESNISTDNDLLEQMKEDLNEKTEDYEEIEEIEEEEPEKNLPETAEIETEKKEENKGINWMIVLGFGAIIISGIIAFMILKMKSGEKETEGYQKETQVKTQGTPVDRYSQLGLPPEF